MERLISRVKQSLQLKSQTIHAEGLEDVQEDLTKSLLNLERDFKAAHQTSTTEEKYDIV